MANERPQELEEEEQQRANYPTRCPSCECDAAKPKAASTVPGEPLMIRLEMLCGRCAHQWTYDKIDEKPD
jgi:C4-type Zn-finger protein